MLTVWTTEALVSAWGEFEMVWDDESRWLSCLACSERAPLAEVNGELSCAECAALCCYCWERAGVMTGKNDNGHPHLVCLECFDSHWGKDGH